VTCLRVCLCARVIEIQTQQTGREAVAIFVEFLDNGFARETRVLWHPRRLHLWGNRSSILAPFFGEESVMHIRTPDEDARFVGTSVLDVVLRAVFGAVRMTLYGALAVLRPFIVLGFAAVSALGLLTCFVYGVLAHGTDFPMGTMLSFSVGCAVLALLYDTLLDLLRRR
jgi:hypothetical protein